jgi:starvation-inducible DNA-binding protein
MKKKILLSSLFTLVCLVFSNSVLIGQEMEDQAMAVKKFKNQDDIAPNTGISQENRDLSIKILNQILSNEFVVYVQTLNYHWNLIGPQFNDYHKLFDDQYGQLFKFIDELAERVRMVGGIAHGTMAAFIQHATLKEDGGDIPTPRQMVKNLLAQHEEVIKKLRGGVNETAQDNRDMGTSNLLTMLLEKHEKMAWMLRSLSVEKVVE